VRYSFLLPMMLLCPAVTAPAQVSIGISLPGLSIGINQPVYPELVQVPGYPVYYAPGASSNFFFYDGMYWVCTDDGWYASEWYNGPWEGVDPNDVPLFVLRVPVTYYRQPPVYFNGWDRNGPPRWGEHWGRGWEQRRSGWDHWDQHSAPAPAPLPVYQRQFTGDRYPQARQQLDLHTQNYHYQPKEAVVRQVVQQQRSQAAAPPDRGKPGDPQQKGMKPEAPPHQQPAPAPRPGIPQPPPATPAPHPGNPQQPQPPAPRPNSPQPPQAAPAPRPEKPQPPQQAPAQRPGNPAPPQHQQPPAPRPGNPAPPPQLQNHEQPQGYPGQGQEKQRGKGNPNDSKKNKEPG